MENEDKKDIKENGELKEEKKEENEDNTEENKEEKKEENKEENKECKKEEKKDKKKEKNEKNKEEKKKGDKEGKKQNKQNKKMDAKDIFKLCDLRVGYVEECKVLEGFNDIYSLVIDLGEPEKRIIGTGLRNHVPIEKIQSSKLVVFSNLKPKKFGTTFVSNGMILTSSLKDGDKEIFELIRPDENAKPGEKVYLDGTELDPKKEEQISPKRFSQIIENLKTDNDCFCTYDGVKLRTESGLIKAPLKNAPIS